MQSLVTVFAGRRYVEPDRPGFKTGSADPVESDRIKHPGEKEYS